MTSLYRKALSVFVFCLFSLAIFAQPSVSPAVGYEWICSSSATYIDGPATTLPSVPDDTSYGINGTDIGCPYVQKQLFGNLGDGRNGGCDGTSAGENFPVSSTEVRSLTLTDWNNPSPSSGVTDGAISGTICIQSEARLRILSSPNPGDLGTGAGGDEMRLEIIGGNSGQQSDFNLTANYDLNWADTRFSTSGGTGVQTVNQPSLTANDAGSGNNYEWTTTSGNNTWLFNPTTQLGIGDTYGEDFMVTSLEDGGDFDINFTSTASVDISRNFGNADARVQFGPGMQGYAQYEVDYKCWTISEITLANELSTFDASNNNLEIRLDWSSIQEINMKQYELERSFDLNDWEKITTVNAENLSTTSNYSFIDNNAKLGINYYRLKQINQDESFQYSPVISSKLVAVSAFDIYPNPVQSNLNIVLTNQEINQGAILITDAQGKIIQEIVLDNIQPLHKLNISTINYAPGLYQINLRTVSGKTVNKNRFVKLSE